MLLRISDDYLALLNLLERNGIQYEIVEDKYKKVLSRRAETLNDIGVINLSDINVDELLNNAINYLNNKIKVNEHSLEHLYNESLVVTYQELKN